MIFFFTCFGSRLVAKATLQLQMSVSPSEIKPPQWTLMVNKHGLAQGDALPLSSINHHHYKDTEVLHIFAKLRTRQLRKNEAAKLKRESIQNSVKKESETKDVKKSLQIVLLLIIVQ